MHTSPKVLPLCVKWNCGIGFLATLAIAIAGFASTASANPIAVVPAGLVAGDTYRLVFVTADTYTATDSNIADYNAEVSAEANSVAALQALDTTWSVIGSTSSVDAITNIGQDPGVPIYDLEGNLIAADATTGTGGLFSTTSVSGTLFDPIQYTEDGGLSASSDVFTGTTYAGNVNPSYPGRVFGGGGALAFVGDTADDNDGWIYAAAIAPNDLLPLYAISGELTVPSSTPEPATTATMIIGLAVLFLAARRRQRVQQANGTNS
jgi:hypothetical protein